ncbi:hypothetical protein [Nannocystis bainbridge]|uniref:Uncharacterized protein n=1 Tax=Nannocystis bainbridge TaxID=2995303 RepID=A0ABT5DZ32_9BACT|nr:hypothetical protein [Nannocystis bainbridge]MDC0718887.1 hypothetical protein [Nannocystis bainbridge]
MPTRPRTILRSGVRSPALLDLLPVGESLVAVHAFVPHHRGGDVVHHRRDGDRWRRRVVRDGDTYHGEVLALAHAADGRSFAIVYWDEQQLWIERFGPAGELELRGALPLEWDDEAGLPELVALAVDATAPRVLACVSPAADERKPRGARRRAASGSRLFEVTPAGARELPLDVTAAALALVDGALVIFGATGEALLRPDRGAEVRFDDKRLVAPRIFAVRERELLLGTADALALVRLGGRTPAITWLSVPFAPQHACFAANGWAAVRARSQLVEVVDAQGRRVARQLPKPAARVALAAGGTLLCEGDAGELRVWTRDEFRALPTVDAAAVVGSLIAGEQPEVPAILAELAPQGAGGLAAELEQLLAAARKQKRDWWFLDLARELAERRAAVALARGDTADAAVDLLFAASVHRDDGEAKRRAAVRKRADAAMATLRATPRAPVRDLACEHLFDLLERTREPRIILAFGRALAESPVLASPTFHLAFGVVATLEWLDQLPVLEGAPASRIDAARELADAARRSLERSSESLPAAALPRLWLAMLHRADDLEPWADRKRAREHEQAVKRCTELGPARITAFLDAQELDGGARWHLQASLWRVGLPARLRDAPPASTTHPS